MSSMLKEILEAEKKAKEFTQQTEKYRAETMAAVEEKKKQIIDDALKDAESQVQKLKERHAKDIENSLKAVENSCKEDIERLQKAEKEKSQAWIEEIYGRVINGDV